MAWKEDWQIGVVIPIHKKRDRSDCTSYRDISSASLQMYAPSALKKDATE